MRNTTLGWLSVLPVLALLGCGEAEEVRQVQPVTEPSTPVAEIKDVQPEATPVYQPRSRPPVPPVAKEPAEVIEVEPPKADPKPGPEPLRKTNPTRDSVQGRMAALRQRLSELERKRFFFMLQDVLRAAEKDRRYVAANSLESLRNIEESNRIQEDVLDEYRAALAKKRGLTIEETYFIETEGFPKGWGKEYMKLRR